MIKELEKIAKGLLVFSLMGLLFAWISPEPVGAVETITMSAVVGSMIQCNTPMNGQTNSFGTITNTAIAAATTSSTTVSSNGSIYVKVYDQGSGALPGLYKDPDLIESPTAANPGNATDTLQTNAEGYGIMATTTGTILIATRYDNASDTDIVGGLKYGAGAAEVLASSGSAISGNVVRIDYKASVAASTISGNYLDTVTLDCTSS